MPEAVQSITDRDNGFASSLDDTLSSAYHLHALPIVRDKETVSTSLESMEILKIPIAINDTNKLAPIELHRNQSTPRIKCARLLFMISSLSEI